MRIKTFFALSICLILTSSFVKNRSSAEILATDKTFIDLLDQTRTRQLNKLSTKGKVGILKKIKYLKKTYKLFDGSLESKALMTEAFHLTNGNQKNAIQLHPTCLEIYFLEFSYCMERYSEDEEFDVNACELAAYGSFEDGILLLSKY